ncbi:allantoate permease [Kwoniella heveanensis BCC8398]|uniref:Allantoate permease n=1 Tax=Kwoniella heveanensis BCC8398 TaxID=1296120 RepID=A0A1B9H3V2_9TREE|nr:allantoate permease [Kwoniella heveanensis BCC8398]
MSHSPQVDRHRGHDHDHEHGSERINLDSDVHLDLDLDHMTEEEYAKAERKVVRKIDFILLPIMLVTYGLQYYDKNTLSTAILYGMLDDLDLTRTVNGVTYLTRYSTAAAAFYYGYIVAVLPMGLVFTRFPLAKTAAFFVLIWGIICLLTVTCTNYPGFVAQRVFLGLAESAVSPAFVAVTALWWKPQEQAKRLGIYYSSTGIFSMFTASLNIGLGKTGGTHPWKSMYYFGGSFTIFWSFIIYFFMPESPLSPGRFFFNNPRDRAILQRRFEENPWGKSQQPLKVAQVIETVKDVKTWIYFLMGTAIYICNGSVTVFGAKIINSWGYDSMQSTALMIPGGAMTVVTIYIFAYFADKYKNIRTILLPISTIPVIIGCLVIWTAPWHPRIGPLIGYYLVAAFGAPYVLLLSLATANTAGATKKGLTTSFIFLGYVVGNICASYLVFTQEKPMKYRSTWISVIVAMVVASALSLVLRYIYTSENRRRDLLLESGGGSPSSSSPGTGTTTTTVAADAGEEEKASEHEHGIATGGERKLDREDASAGAAYEDKTDKQRPEFRYTL